MIFPNGTIRVVSPVREGGNRVRVDDMGRPMYKEEYFPLSAKREFDRQNRSLPNHLKKKIEVVSDGDVQPIRQPAQHQTSADVVIKKRGGRPKKNA